MEKHIRTENPADDSKLADTISVKNLQSINKNSSGRESAVWEEALIQEFLYAIGHLNHCEQHLMEIDSSIGMTLFGDIINRVREQRKIVGEALFFIEKLEAVKGSDDVRTSWESIWCTLKHLVTALIHIDECIEKMLKRIGGGSGDELIKYTNILLNVRHNISESLIQLLSRARTSAEIITKASVRCREDLCVEF